MIAVIRAAGAFAKASANPSSDPARRRIGVSFWFADCKNARGGGRVPPSIPKRVLKIQKLGPYNAGKGLYSLPREGGRSSVGVGSNCTRAPFDPNPSVLRVRADCGGRLFPAKFGVVVHYLPHQLLNHLLPDDATIFRITKPTPRPAIIPPGAMRWLGAELHPCGHTRGSRRGRQNYR